MKELIPERGEMDAEAAKFPAPLAKVPGYIISINALVCVFELHYIYMFPSAILLYSMALQV